MQLVLEMLGRQSGERYYSETREEAMLRQLADLISTVIRAKGGGLYTVGVRVVHDFGHDDTLRFFFTAFEESGRRIDLPSPDWLTAPEWANFWVLNQAGYENWHEFRPWIDQDTNAFWQTKGAMTVTGTRYKLPIGVDWRAFLVERPQHMIARLGPIPEGWKEDGQTV